MRGMERNLDAASWFLVGQIKRNMGKNNAPKIKTSRLQNSITMENKGRLRRWVGSTIVARSGQKQSYPYYQELGYTTVSGKRVMHPWLRPALDTAKSGMVKILGRDVT